MSQCTGVKCFMFRQLYKWHFVQIPWSITTASVNASSTLLMNDWGLKLAPGNSVNLATLCSPRVTPMLCNKRQSVTTILFHTFTPSRTKDPQKMCYFFVYDLVDLRSCPPPPAIVVS